MEGVRQTPGASLPFLAVPHDSLRHGLPALKADSQTVHPIASVQAGTTRTHSESEMQANLYGTAFPARRAIERQILARVHRLPGSGLPSARLGLEVMTGDVESFAFESYLGFPGEKEAGPAGDIHTVMEARLGLSHGPAPSRPLR